MSYFGGSNNDMAGNNSSQGTPYLPWSEYQTIENMGATGLCDGPYDGFYFINPLNYSYAFSGLQSGKPRGVQVDPHTGALPARDGSHWTNGKVWSTALELRQRFPHICDWIVEPPSCWQDLYHYWDGEDLFQMGPYNAHCVINTIIAQNKMADQTAEPYFKTVLPQWLDQWMACQPDAEERILSWDYTAEFGPGARVVLQGMNYYLFPENLIWLNLEIAKRYDEIVANRQHQLVQAASAAASAAQAASATQAAYYDVAQAALATQAGPATQLAFASVPHMQDGQGAAYYGAQPGPYHPEAGLGICIPAPAVQMMPVQTGLMAVHHQPGPGPVQLAPIQTVVQTVPLQTVAGLDNHQPAVLPQESEPWGDTETLVPTSASTNGGAHPFAGPQHDSGAPPSGGTQTLAVPQYSAHVASASCSGGIQTPDAPQPATSASVGPDIPRPQSAPVGLDLSPQIEQQQPEVEQPQIEAAPNNNRHASSHSSASTINLPPVTEHYTLIPPPLIVQPFPPGAFDRPAAAPAPAPAPATANTPVSSSRPSASDSSATSQARSRGTYHPPRRWDPTCLNNVVGRTKYEPAVACPCDDCKMQSCSIYVRDHSSHVSCIDRSARVEQALRAHFERFGAIKHMHVRDYPDDAAKRTQAVIRFESGEIARQALAATNKQLCPGLQRPLQVVFPWKSINQKGIPRPAPMPPPRYTPQGQGYGHGYGQGYGAITSTGPHLYQPRPSFLLHPPPSSTASSGRQQDATMWPMPPHTSFPLPGAPVPVPAPATTFPAAHTHSTYYQPMSYEQVAQSRAPPPVSPPAAASAATVRLPPSPPDAANDNYEDLGTVRIRRQHQHQHQQPRKKLPAEWVGVGSGGSGGSGFGAAAQGNNNSSTSNNNNGGNNNKGRSRGNNSNNNSNKPPPPPHDGVPPVVRRAKKKPARSAAAASRPPPPPPAPATTIPTLASAESWRLDQEAERPYAAPPPPRTRSFAAAAAFAPAAPAPGRAISGPPLSGPPLTGSPLTGPPLLPPSPFAQQFPAATGAGTGGPGATSPGPSPPTAPGPEPGSAAARLLALHHHQQQQKQQ